MGLFCGRIASVGLDVIIKVEQRTKCSTQIDPLQVLSIQVWRFIKVKNGSSKTSQQNLIMKVVVETHHLLVHRRTNDVFSKPSSHERMGERQAIREVPKCLAFAMPRKFPNDIKAKVHQCPKEGQSEILPKHNVLFLSVCYQNPVRTRLHQNLQHAHVYIPWKSHLFPKWLRLLLL